MKRALSLCLSLLLLLCGGLVCAADDEPHTHVFGEWYTVTEPTCTDEGEERRDCEGCDAFETRPIDPCHSFGEWYTFTEPTCTDEGEERRDCEGCDAFETRPIDPRHKFGEWYTFIEPSCTDEGEERRDCEGCDAFETRVVPALYHSFVIDPAVPATCTTAGKTQGEHCELCGAVKTKQVTLKPLGHAVLDENGNCRLCGEHIKDLCPYCHRDHSGELFGSLTAWLHRLFYSVRIFLLGT
ncbi:MAG: hypothetical protein IKR49_01290 [Clostridia bacterium]|nr:hypothetical protein [Clostridia bacterium]